MIDKTNRLINNLASSELVIQKIINTSFKKLGFAQDFKSKNLKKITKGDFTYFLYLYNSKEIASDWEEFLPKNLTKGEDFIQQKLSLILFIETEHHLFCVIGGNAHQIVLPFIDQSFGLSTYARIMQPENDELASIKSRGITGARAGLSEQFRNNYRIIDFIKFGKVPKDIHLRLSQETTDLYFKFLKSKKNDRIKVYVGRAFQIKKTIDFKTLHKITIELCFILELVPSDYLSSYEEITDETFKSNRLHPELITRIFNDTENLGKRNQNSGTTFEHDFCNPNNIEKFYEADEFKLKAKTDSGGYKIFKIVSDRNEIYDAVLNRAVELCGVNDRFKLMVFIQGVRITCYQNNKKTIASSFLFHISTEFPIDGKPVFLVDTKWYHLRDSFVEDLKSNTKHVLRTYSAPPNVVTEKWDKQIIRKEKDYNLLYDSILNYIVIDTIIEDGLELCDILHYDNRNLYLIHVKYGFKSEIRELTNQITISARRLINALGTDDKLILEKIYKKLVEKKRSVNSLTLEEFKELFDKKITFVLAFTSHLKMDLDVLTNVDSFSSNIARYSLIQCSGEMRANYFPMLTHQIMRK